MLRSSRASLRSCWFQLPRVTASFFRFLAFLLRTTASGASGIFLNDERSSSAIRVVVRISEASLSLSTLVPLTARSSSATARRISIWLRRLPRRMFFRLDAGHSPYTFRRSFRRLFDFLSCGDLTLLIRANYAALQRGCREAGGDSIRVACTSALRRQSLKKSRRSRYPSAEIFF